MNLPRPPLFSSPFLLPPFSSPLLLPPSPPLFSSPLLLPSSPLSPSLSSSLLPARNKDNSWPEEMIAIMKEVKARDKDKDKEKAKTQG